MKQYAVIKSLFPLIFLVIAGCASEPDSARQDLQNITQPSSDQTAQPDLIPVLAALHDQMHSWQGTPYHWGGTNLKGVDCSGFVWRTLKDRFNLPVSRLTTTELIKMGTRVDKKQLRTGDLVFFRIHKQLHVGFYDTKDHFLHASYSKGVMRSSLDNPYWKSVYYQSRRLKKEVGAEISFNAEKSKLELARQ
ncbi:NlpC/P60 family protein [Erwinia pyri]|uniref:NlpC/P60 family protein n=1 Tax=Erwinia pyri TaxID=3062598 RepID=A0AA50DN87_9GAMM|nr:NlpC/P60 family protein [Erwinia sp. DE2]WLS80847.1 NlpC/P60 family protein [Erwinia sp. DE2]